MKWFPLIQLFPWGDNAVCTTPADVLANNAVQTPVQKPSGEAWEG